MVDRYGRKPVIYAGLAVFAAGSFVAALGLNIYVVILGRMLQGAGAISAAVMAMLADLTRDEHRAKAMALIGSTIGGTFALSLVLSPWLNRVIGVPSIFAMTGVLVLAAIGVVYVLVPDVPEQPRRADTGGLRQFAAVLADPQEHWHGGSMTRKSKLDDLYPEALVEVNPADAARMDITDGQAVRVSSRRGSVVLRARVTRKTTLGVVFIPFHFAEAAANLLTIDALDPLAKIPEYKACAVRVVPARESELPRPEASQARGRY